VSDARKSRSTTGRTSRTAVSSETVKRSASDSTGVRAATASRGVGSAKKDAAPVPGAVVGLLRSPRVRAGVLGALVLGALGIVTARAYRIQVVERDKYDRTYPEAIEIAQKRGNIYDRRGAELAVSVELDSFYANPSELVRREKKGELDLGKTSEQLAAVLGLKGEALEEKLRSGKKFVWLKRRVSPAQSKAMAELGLGDKGVGAHKEPRRYYPNLSTAAHVLGFTDDEGKGVEGLERSYEGELRGSAGRVAAILDARGGVVFSEAMADAQGGQGHHLHLTIDREIQAIAERELSLGVRSVEARAGSLVAMDPNTGEILALANYPSFNPNEPGGADPAARRNRAVMDRFEPGSVVKTFTIAGALAAGVVGPSQRIDCEDGAMRVAEYTIHDTHRHGELTPGEILALSSNIGTAKIGDALGRAGLYRYLRRFGFGARTELDLPAETEGILRNYKKWYEMDAATISFGQGMSATSIQLAAAMASIANGGRLMKPLLVSRVSDSAGETVASYAPTVKRQVVPGHVARLVGDMLTAVTEPGGTGEAAAMDGFVVAGKTGTAQKADYAKGGYADGQWTSTFVGFVPAQSPRLVISVVIDEPVIDHYGGTVAGPVFKRVASEALRQLGVSPSHGAVKLADIVKAEREQKKAEAEKARAKDEKAAKEAADAELAAAADETAEPEAGPGQVRVPKLAGLGGRAALVQLQKLGLSAHLTGTGAVVEQTPSAGHRVLSGAVVQLVLRRPEPVRDAKRGGESDAEGELAKVSALR
jgi:cell division protein FtsI (penicillin-binding protein 3)